MTFAGINYLAVVVAAVVAWLAGASGTDCSRTRGWRRTARPWSSSSEQAAHKGSVHAWLPFALAFLPSW
jgi:hypothetical protein